MSRVSLLFIAWGKFTWYFLHSVRIRRPWSLAPHTWILLYFRGFLPNKLDLYGLRGKNWKPYLNDRQVLLTPYINGDYGAAINNKLLSSMILRGFATIPETYAVIRDGKIIGAQSEESADLAIIIRRKEKAVLKPTGNNGGKGVMLLEFRGGAYFLNNKVCSSDQVNHELTGSGEFILSEYIRQGEYASSLYPDTVNTIRILTMLHPDSGMPFIAGATQRIGTSRSFPVDNVSSGGLACLIDIQTGRLGKASRVFMERPFRWIERHPESGIQFEGQVIPQWAEICSKTIGLAKTLPMIPYIAWDIALLDDGICIIETNSWSEMSAFQLKEPLTVNPQISRFFEHHRIRKNRNSYFRTEAK